MTSISEVELRNSVMMMRVTMMKLLIEMMMLLLLFACVCFEKDQLCKMIWAKRPLTHSRIFSTMIH